MKEKYCLLSVDANRLASATSPVEALDIALTLLEERTTEWSLMQKLKANPANYRDWLDGRDRWRKQEGDSLKPPGQISAELRTAAVSTLREVARGKARMPGDMAWELADAIEALSAGQDECFLLPENLDKRKQAGRHPFRVDLRRAAMDYLLLVSRGDISDPKPMHTITLNYGVTRQTVYNWKKQSSKIENPESDPAVAIIFMRSAGRQWKKQRKHRKQKDQ